MGTAPQHHCLANCSSSGSSIRSSGDSICQSVRFTIKSNTPRRNVPTSTVQISLVTSPWSTVLSVSCPCPCRCLAPSPPSCFCSCPTLVLCSPRRSALEMAHRFPPSLHFAWLRGWSVSFSRSVCPDSRILIELEVPPQCGRQASRQRRNFDGTYDHR